MGHDQHDPPCREGGCHALVPERENPLDRVGQAFGARQLARRHGGVAAVPAGQALVSGLERRRPGGPAAPPLPDLRLARLLRRLRLAQPLERPIVALVQPPAPLDRQPHEVEIVLDDPERPDRPLEERREAKIEQKPGVADQAGRPMRLSDALLGEVDIGPAGEPVLVVPGAPPVAEQEKARHSSALPMASDRRSPRAAAPGRATATSDHAI